MGAGLSHSSDEVCEGEKKTSRVGGAKGRAEQGTRVKETRAMIPSIHKLSPELIRVQERAKSKPKERFTSLAHYLTVETLGRSYERLNKDSAVGIDGISKAEYGENLDARLLDLQRRLKGMKYRATPVLRVYIEKEDGSKRPIGIPTTEDKVVQGAVVEILCAIYEVDFYGFSYGFRPGKSAHNALQSLQTVLQKGEVNWVIDADISKFFDSIDHKELMSVIRHRVVDRSLLRIIGKWLSAGAVEEDGRRIRGKQGTPQGGIISPMLANIFLHTVLDNFVQEWRRTGATGEVYIVRYADDFVIATERKEDAEILLSELKKRLESFGLKLHPEKTRIIKFGRKWVEGKRSGGDKPGTFNFLGFTHIAGKDRRGNYLVKRKTMSKRLHRAIRNAYQICRGMMHFSLKMRHARLRKILTGHFNYYGVRGNFDSLRQFYYEVRKIWYRILKHKSQKGMKFCKYERLLLLFPLPKPKITHPEGWLSVDPGYLLGRAGCGKSARPVL